MAILAFAVAGIVMPLMAGTNQSYLSSRYTVAVNLAQALMDEILAKPFHDPQAPSSFNLGPGPGEDTRPELDNIDDYHGLVEPAGGLEDANGQSINEPTLSRFSRYVWAEYVYLPGQDDGDDPTFILVMVQVKDGSMPMVTLKRLISSAERTVVP